MIIKPIPRYNVGMNDACTETTECPNGEWVRVSDVEAVFAPGVVYMPVPRCETCKHWTVFEDDAQPATVGGLVDELKHDGLWPEEFVLPRLGDCMASTGDGAKMSAGTTAFRERLVETHHDFGCVQWTPK